MPRVKLPLVLTLASVLVACTDPPGKLVGAYGITMHLDSNNCGANGLPLADGYQYTAELRADAEHGYWRTPKAPEIYGNYDAGAGAFRFEIGNTLDLGSADAGTSGCTVDRDEVLQGVVVLPNDAGIAEASDAGDAGSSSDTPLTGTHTITFTPDPNGRCAGSIGPLGPFSLLPCAATYHITGTKHRAF